MRRPVLVKYFFLFLSSFLAERWSERPGAVKGAIVRRERTLDGEDRSAIIPSKRKKAQLPWFLIPTGTSCPAPQSTVATLPSALLCERFLRSVQVGCSRFSWCCHLIIDLWFHHHDRTWARRLTQSPKLGFGLCVPRIFLSMSYAAAGTVA
jgi:hypothetical protein